jgi:hypothetical protein
MSIAAYSTFDSRAGVNSRASTSACFASRPTIRIATSSMRASRRQMRLPNAP